MQMARRRRRRCDPSRPENRAARLRFWRAADNSDQKSAFWEDASRVRHVFASSARASAQDQSSECRRRGHPSGVCRRPPGRTPSFSCANCTQAEGLPHAILSPKFRADDVTAVTTRAPGRIRRACDGSSAAPRARSCFRRRPLVRFL